MIILTSILTICLALQVSCIDPTYVVYPKDGKNNGQTEAINKQLEKFAKPTDIYTSKTKKFGINFWKLPLSRDELKKVHSIKDVASVNRQCTKDCYDPTTALVRQNEATDEMVFISQEEGRDLAWYKKNYIYDDTAGEGIEVYIVDTGANLAHDEFTKGGNIASRARWIFVEPDWNGQRPKNDVLVHGTCMLSKAGGYQYGSAKIIKPVIVRAALRTGERSLAFRPEDHLEGVAKVLDDVGDGKKAILLMSWFFPRVRGKADGKTIWSFPDPLDESKDGSDGFRIRLRMLLGELVRKGVSPVTGSGNDAATSIDGWPASFGKHNDKLNYISELIVVGATNNQGKKHGTTNVDHAGGLPHVWAPGQNVQCADAGDNNGYRKASGTSVAAATTAGLAAYFLKLGQNPQNGVVVTTPQEMKNYIIGEAWARADHLRAIWNGVNAGFVGEHGGDCPIRRRDGDPKDPKYKKCTGKATTQKPKPKKHQYTCTEYPGDRRGQQCSCTPTDCKVGEKDCLAVIGVKGKGGCDDKCQGCKFG